MRQVLFLESFGKCTATCGGAITKSSTLKILLSQPSTTLIPALSAWLRTDKLHLSVALLTSAWTIVTYTLAPTHSHGKYAPNLVIESVVETCRVIAYMSVTVLVGTLFLSIWEDV
ncbi:hypothetical protein RSOLAG1IB_10306 [Rhizoctonia solani AG-1 IB]|uniref:Uncharacterized protein n=1 Tax=Thanatephorus cucumeris (strain AG1-IB / isolate 7/3/14) TaxID=1108050 RepID=A0A0B7G1A2_THACB|nr:hypothetical protein RSOLAG1IB_10306 [Rhizoctonia solani AG-1 IB]